MSLKVISNPSIEFLLESVGKQINSVIKDSEVLLLISGGSSLAILNNISVSLINSNITISVLDERYTSNTSINNFSQIMQTAFYRFATKSGCSFIDSRPTGETLTELALRLDQELKEWKQEHREGHIIATQGIGEDGHTSGIMPYPENETLFRELFEDEKKWVVGYDAGNKNRYPMRATTTIPFLKMIDFSFMYVVGENKKEVLQKALSSETKLHEVPSKVIQEMKNVEVYTDQKVEVT